MSAVVLLILIHLPTIKVFLFPIERSLKITLQSGKEYYILIVRIFFVLTVSLSTTSVSILARILLVPVSTTAALPLLIALVLVLIPFISLVAGAATT